MHEIFLKSIPKIFIGASNQSHKVELCQNTLSKLFNSVMNEKEAKAMSLYLLDVFLASPNYVQACTNLSMNLILVNRLFSPNEYRPFLPPRELRDILDLLKNNKQFAFESYVGKALPKILLNLKKKTLADSLQRNLESLSSQPKPKPADPPVPLTHPSYLDTCIGANQSGMFTLYLRKGGEQYKVRWNQKEAEELNEIEAGENESVKEFAARINENQYENNLQKKVRARKARWRRNLGSMPRTWPTQSTSSTRP